MVIDLCWDNVACFRILFHLSGMNALVKRKLMLRYCWNDLVGFLKQKFVFLVCIFTTVLSVVCSNVLWFTKKGTKEK